MRRSLLLGAAVAAVLVSACYGTAELATQAEGGGPGAGGGSGGPAGGGSGNGTGGGDGSGELPYVCDTSTFTSGTLDTVKAQFGAQVFPLLTRTNSGCVGCHDANSARAFKVTASADETFALARTAGFFEEKPGSLYDRLVNPLEAVRMPRGMPAWTTAESNTVAQVSCALKALGPLTPPDEEFPPQLLTAWDGGPSDYYDTRFADYTLLKSKVKSVFNDSWVRDGGTNMFEKNIALFGGVNFTSNFVPARTATSEFLLGLDSLAPDICSAAVANLTGPFAGTAPTQAIVDTPAQVTTRQEAETAANKTSGGAVSGGWNLYSNGNVSNPINFAGTGNFTFRVNARQTMVAGSEPAKIELRVDGVVLTTFDVPNTALQLFTFTANNLAGGTHDVAVAFINDFYDDTVTPVQDRNVVIDYFEVTGPLGSGTGTTRKDAALASINLLYERMLFRSPTAEETAAAYALLLDLTNIPVPLASAWSGLCEALVRHPDFLFTRPPAMAATTGAAQKKLQLTMLAQELLGRTATSAELDAYSGGQKTWSEMVDTYLASTDFANRYFERFRFRTESNGTAEADEPARLWTFIATNDAPMQDLFVGEYSVSPTFQKLTRGTEHGKTGVLTMKGFIKGKQGLPHYNYSARVLTDFMGYVFEVPPEVFDQRATATAASTVDTSSACFQCHQLLTPLAHQRLKWDDDGNYRTTVDGVAIDDSDRNMVATYPYKGSGIQSFSTTAVRKERFIRRTVNAQFEYLIGRELRADQDERGLYKELWDVNSTQNGSLKAVLRHILNSPTYKRL